ncbi:alcohol acetyltransferase [Cerioporus squamosus]|nr:alcohol acetyltransferase [Cerioporus squamosus]
MTDTEKVVEKQDAGASTSGRVLRKGGRLEHFFDVRSRLNLTGYVTVSARYTSGSPLTKPTLFSALEDAIRKNIALGVRFAPGSPNSGVWVALPVVDLNRVVKFVDKDRADLPALLEELFAQPVDFSEDVPQWRLMVLRDGWVVFAYDHTLGDGQSGLGFHHNLLASLRSVHDPPSEHSGIVSSLPQDATLTPALEDAIDTSVPLRKLAQAIVKTVLPFIDRKKGKAWAGYPFQQPPTLVTRVRLLDYTPNQASNLRKISRDHKATLTSTIHTLALVILSRLIYAQPANKKYKHILTYIPMSLRRFTGAPPSAICNHVSSFNAYYPLFRPAPGPTISKDTFPWQSASALTAALRRELPRSAPAVGMLKYLSGKYEAFILGRLSRPREPALELSNLGAFPEPPTKEGEEPQWRIEEMFFVQSDPTLGAALKVNPVGTGAGGLGISITWGEGAVDDEFAEEFVKAFDEGLKTLAQ